MLEEYKHKLVLFTPKGNIDATNAAVSTINSTDSWPLRDMFAETDRGIIQRESLKALKTKFS